MFLYFSNRICTIFTTAAERPAAVWLPSLPLRLLYSSVTVVLLVCVCVCVCVRAWGGGGRAEAPLFSINNYTMSISEPSK